MWRGRWIVAEAAASGGTSICKAERTCNSATRLLGIDSQPDEPGTITMSVALLKQADNAHLRGFEITPAGAPNPVSRP